uniref:Uncharacterized protein n=1 Tax=Globodera rostochiensis TaxID=31243 RepID=A0A914IE27_GLORO
MVTRCSMRIFCIDRVLLRLVEWWDKEAVDLRLGDFSLRPLSLWKKHAKKGMDNKTDSNIGKNEAGGRPREGRTGGRSIGQKSERDKHPAWKATNQHNWLEESTLKQ